MLSRLGYLIVLVLASVFVGPVAAARRRRGNGGAKTAVKGTASSAHVAHAAVVTASRADQATAPRPLGPGVWGVGSPRGTYQCGLAARLFNQAQHAAVDVRALRRRSSGGRATSSWPSP